MAWGFSGIERELHDAGGEGGQTGELMAYEQDCMTRRESGEDFIYSRLERLVDVRQRFVKHEEPRAGGEGACEERALELSSGQSAYASPEKSADTAEFLYFLKAPAVAG